MFLSSVTVALKLLSSFLIIILVLSTSECPPPNPVLLLVSLTLWVVPGFCFCSFPCPGACIYVLGKGWTAGLHLQLSVFIFRQELAKFPRLTLSLDSKVVGITGLHHQAQFALWTFNRQHI